MNILYIEIFFNFQSDVQDRDNQSQNLFNPPIEDDGNLKRLSEHTRSGFITKVYGIIMFQLAFTVIFVVVSIESSIFKGWMQKHTWSIWVAFLIVIICMVALCYRNVARKIPINYILLFVFTFFYSYIVSLCSIIYPPNTVLYAAL